MYKVVSVFSGCGGADLGLLGGFEFNKEQYQRLPYNIVYATDINEKALNTYKKNFDCHKVVCDDIQNINASEIPDHDVLMGGFPCQSFSTVNPNKDPFDDRANLYKEMIRILKAKSPKAFIAENVRGFMTLHKGKIFSRVIKEFELAGYKTYSMLMNSADYGIPQKRQRVIIIGIRDDLKKEYIFPKKTTANEWVPLSVAVKSLVSEDNKYYFSKRAVEGMKKAKNNMKRGLYQNLNEPCLTITSHLAKVSLNSRDPVLLVDPENELYRRFTPREAARIQSFPDEFVFAGSEGDAYRQIGNAVPPVLAWHIAKSLLEVLDAEKSENGEIIFNDIANLKYQLA
ncbi:DNA cytosine methyltransferase [Marinisporobacter balticus]|uniref:DNA cytosine methyltransferase n=1 Tax=Marinisporobacter balticus TaxID=2018667 RepID=UPI001043F51E|nr:DNA (cytosine-5-)-methyltransferase [Marinisporobacter balticus]